MDAWFPPDYEPHRGRGPAPRITAASGTWPGEHSSAGISPLQSLSPSPGTPSLLLYLRTRSSKAPSSRKEVIHSCIHSLIQQESIEYPLCQAPAKVSSLLIEVLKCPHFPLGVAPTRIPNILSIPLKKLTFPAWCYAHTWLISLPN